MRIKINFSLFKEAKLLFKTKSPEGPSMQERKEQEQKYKESFGMNMKEAREYNAKLSSAFAKMKKIEFKKSITSMSSFDDAAKKVANKFKTLPIKLRKRLRLDFRQAIISKLTPDVVKNLYRLSPVQVKFENGVLSFKKGNVEFSINALEDSPSLKMLAVYEQTRNRTLIDNKVNRGNFRKTLDFSGKFGNLHQAIKNSPKLKGKCTVTEKDGKYVIKFLGKNAAERRKNEKNLKIEDIFNLDLVNRYPSSVLRIKLYHPKNGRRLIAEYHPSSRTFYKAGTKDPVKVYNGTTIEILEFRVVPIKRVEAKKVKKVDKRKLARKRNLELDRQAGFEKDQRKDRLFATYGDFIFKDKRFGGHKLLQTSDDFKNWNRLSHKLAPILAQPPFNIKNPTQQKKFMELVIQGRGLFDPNWEIQGKDFFKYGVNLYRGGHENFSKDYKKLVKKYDSGVRLTDKESDKLTNIENIAVAIARVYEALRTMKPLKADKESNNEKLNRTVFLNMPKASKAEMKNVESGRYNRKTLKELLHKSEGASEGTAVMIPGNLQLKIRNQLSRVGYYFPHMKDGALKEAMKNPTRFFFMSHGLDTLVRRGYLKKVDNHTIVLVKVPNTFNWATKVFVTLEKKKKFETGNMKNWERVRGRLDTNQRAQNFIKKIFSSKETSVKNNLRSGWSRFWRMEWANKKYVTMSTLHQKTYGRNDFELEAVEKRGFMDMKRKVAERYGDSGMYEIPENKHGRLLQLANDYLAKGLELTIMNAPKEKVAEIMNKLKKQFGIVGTFEKPLQRHDNVYQNVSMILSQARLSSLDVAGLSEAHVKFIRLGFLEARYLETVSNVEMKEQYYSHNPKIRMMQEKLRKQGMALSQLPKVELDFKAGLGALMQSKKLVGVGGFVGFTLRYKTPQGHSVHASAGVGGLKTGVTVHAALGAAFKLGTAKLYFDAGAGVGWVKGTGVIGGGGGSIRIEQSVTPDSAHSIGFGAAAGAGLGGFGVSLLLYWRYDQEKALKNEVKEGMKKFQDIENISGYSEYKINLIRNHPDENVKGLVAYADRTFKGKCPGPVLYYLWERTKGKIINAIGRNQSLPWFKGAGIAVGASPVGIGGGVYFTFQIPFTQEVVAVRHVVGRFNQFDQEDAAERTLSEKLGKQVAVIKNFTMRGKNALVFFDSQIGGVGLSRFGILKDSKEAKLSAHSSFEQIKKILTGLQIDAKLVERKPKGYFIQITPLNIEGSNVEFQIDPDLKSKGMILDNQSTPQRLLLTASAVKALMVTRKRIKFPFRSKGAMDLNIITFKTRSSRGTSDIRNESFQYLYKKNGERYQVVKGENTRDLYKRDANVLTLAEFRQRVGRNPHRYERFDNIPLINFREYRKSTRNMSLALLVREAKEFRLRKENVNKIAPYATSWFKNARNAKYFRSLVLTMSPTTENANKKKLFNRLKNDYAKKNPGLPGLNDYELNLMYSILINESFTNLEKDKSKMSVRKINVLLKRRNELFRRFMVTYITKWKAKYKEEWSKIKELDPSITPKKIANFLLLCMPQNYQQLQDKLQRPENIEKDMKFMSFTQKDNKKAMPSVYGAANPASIQKKFFKMFGSTELKLDSLDNKQQAIARTVFNMLSPLQQKELETFNEKKEFLQAELPLMLISLYDAKKGISPMIEVLGKGNFDRMTEIFHASRRNDNAKLQSLLADPITDYARTFAEFRKMTLKVRNAQLSGRKSVKYNGFTFHMNTEVKAGPYLKCGNGTVLARQRFRITTKKTLRVPWTGAYAERNVLVKGRQSREAAWLTAMVGLFYKPRKRPVKEEVPDRFKQPPKREIESEEPVKPQDSSNW